MLIFIIITLTIFHLVTVSSTIKLTLRMFWGSFVRSDSSTFLGVNISVKRTVRLNGQPQSFLHSLFCIFPYFMLAFIS